VTNTQKILIIKLGALGDFIQASGPFATIRRHHLEAEITLLTASAFADFARASPWFDKVEIDSRPKTLQISKWLDLRRWLRGSKFSRIYDLQTSDRSGFYFKLLWPNINHGDKPDWSGIAPGCSHPHANQKRDLMHTVERQQEQLSMAGITEVKPSDLSWVTGDISRFGLAEKFALIVPGGAAHRPAKRWPIENYQALLQHLITTGIQPVLLGGEEERALLEELAATDLACISLASATTISDLFALAQKAEFAIGNDTGPMHAAAASGCKTIVLYSAASDPALCAQRGPDVTILREDTLSDIAPLRLIELLAPETTHNQT
jgi:ADP-heptose:LPS heptosyltransferase